MFYFHASSAAINNNPNAPATNTFVPAAYTVCRGAEHSADRRVGRGGRRASERRCSGD